MCHLAISTLAKEGPYEAAKWQKIALLLDPIEMKELFDELGDFSLYLVSHPVEDEKALIKKEVFLSFYDQYVNQLKNNEIIDQSIYRSIFSAVATKDKEALYAMRIKDKLLIKQRSAALQLQLHRFTFSEEKFFPMAHSKENVSFGILFSFPQLYKDPKTGSIIKMSEKQDVNYTLFKELSRWMRKESKVVVFQHKEKKLVAPFRLGKLAYKWIDQYQKLKDLNLKVVHDES